MARDWQKNEPSARKSAPLSPSPHDPTVDVLITRVASRQRQLIRLVQLRDCGLGERGAQDRAASGRLHRIHAGVYAIHPPPYDRRQLYLAAVYACGPGSVVSDLCSAAILGLVERFPFTAEVTNRTGRGRDRERIIVHRRLIDPRDVTHRHGIPCTSAARTILDCAHALGAEGTEDMIMAADSLPLLNRRRLEQLADENRGRAGIAHILAVIADDPVETRSRNERRMFSICRELGIPRPQVNHRLETAERTFYADFCWPELRLIVEADSWRWHGGRQASEDDADRDQLLSIAGWRVVHFTRDQIVKRRPETGRRLLALTADQRSRSAADLGRRRW